MRIEEVATDKRRYMPLLLVGDESERMIDRYLDRGTLYVGFVSGRAVAVCVTVAVGADVVEVKNLAVSEGFRCRGIGRAMLEHVEDVNRGRKIMLGTGETPSTLRFYRSCGYLYSHRVPGFFRDNYDEPIVEEGVELCDMLYLIKINSK